MQSFLITSAIALGIFLGIYYLLLEREKMHRFNRLYLLGAVVASLALPFISIPVYVEAEPQPIEITDAALPQMIQQNPQVVTTPSVPETNYMAIALWGLYGAVVLVLAIRFGSNIIKLYRLAKRNDCVTKDGATVVLLQNCPLPYTFMNYIFVSAADYENKTIEKELLAHELTHVRQHHTLDILFIELLKTVLWFNPLLYLCKNAMQMNHEFLADERTINQFSNIKTYQQMLLDKAIPQPAYALASSINFGITKKRFKMMNKTTTKLKKTVLQAMTLPVLVLTSFLLCHEVIAQTKPDNDATKDITKKDWKGIAERNVTQKETDSVRKLDSKKYTSTNPDDYVHWTTTYTDDNGKEVTEKTIQESRTAKNFDASTYKWPDSDKIKAINVYKYNEAQNDSLKKVRPELYGDSKIQYTRMHLTYENEQGQIVEEDLFVSQMETDESKGTLKVKANKITSVKNPVVVHNEEPIVSYNDTDPKPEFPGGIDGFYKSINKEMKIPEMKDDTTVRIYVQFVIEPDGSMSNIKVMRDPGYGLGDETIRTLNSIKEKWSPGKINSKPVRTRYNVPITINVKK